MTSTLPARLLADSLRVVPEEALGDTVHRLGAVQMDPVQVVAPAHLWTLSLRRGPTSNRDLDAALAAGQVLEGYTHARCLVAARDGAALVRRWRRQRAENSARAYGVADEMREIMARLEQEPGLAARELLTDRRVQGWWESDAATTSKATTIALDLLWMEGRVVVCGRGPEGKRYDLLARRHPDLDARIEQLPDAEALEAALRHTARSWKVFRPAWAAAGFGRGAPPERRRWQGWLLETGEVHAERAGDVEVLVHRSFPEEVEPFSGTRLLAPLDNLLWSRDRLQTLFGFYYRWEVYTPEERRRFGPYNMPVLSEGAFWGQADPRTVKGRLSVRWHPTTGRRVPEAVRAAGREARMLARAIRTEPSSARTRQSRPREAAPPVPAPRGGRGRPKAATPAPDPLLRP